VMPACIALDRWLDEHVDDASAWPAPVAVTPPRWATVPEWPGVSVCEDGRVDGHRGPVAVRRGWVRIYRDGASHLVRVDDLVAAAFGGSIATVR
jgi:hypothetical protein